MPVNGSLSVKQTSQRRSIVFDPQKRDIVVDLDDLIANRIGLDAFFGEIYLTEGIKTPFGLCLQTSGRRVRAGRVPSQASGGQRQNPQPDYVRPARQTPPSASKGDGQFYLPDPQ